MTLQSPQSICTRASLGSRSLALCMALIGTLLGIGLLAIPSHAAESIAAYLDANGRMVFVNEGVNSSVNPPKKAASPKISSAAQSGRRVIASSEPTGAPKDASAVPEQPTPVASGEAVQEQDESASQQPARAANLDSLIEQAAARHQIDPELVKAIVRVESNYNPYAVSPAGAQGLMQLIPATAMRFGVANPFDPQANLDGGIRYLKYLLGQYGGNLPLSLAAYNAGEDAVARSGGTIPSIRETQDYIRRIAQLYPQQAMPGGVPPAPSIVKFVDSTGVVHFSNTDF
jgi:soluble lytic murein transglycosylase-like protein